MMRNSVSRMLCSISVVSLVSATPFPLPPSSISSRGKHQRWIQLHDGVAVHGFHSERGQHRGRWQTLREFGERELLHRNQVHDHVGAQIPRKAGCQIAREVLMQKVD